MGSFISARNKDFTLARSWIGRFETSRRLAHLKSAPFRFASLKSDFEDPQSRWLAQDPPGEVDADQTGLTQISAPEIGILESARSD
jgi:hypothetical protein